MGSGAAIKNHVRDMGWESLASTVWQDIRYGARLMRRSPAFTAVAVLVLAIGIGVNTALFSIVNALFFALPPVKTLDELVYLYKLIGDRAQPVPEREIEILAAFSADLAKLTSHTKVPMNLTADGETVTAVGEVVDGRYFDVLGIPPALGRTVSAAEDDPATTELGVVISHDLWVRRFRADPGIIGTEIRVGRLNGASRSFTVVGVMNRGFHGLSDPWSPSQLWITATQTDGRRHHSAGWPILRLKPGVTLERLRALLDAATWAMKDE